MPSFSGKCREIQGLALVGAMVAMIGAAAPRPALAGDDGQAPIWTGLGGLIGLTGKDPEPPINYRERARLVLPPKMDLPPPLPPVQQRTAGWPLDQEVVKFRKAAEDRAKEAQEQSETAALRAGHPLSPLQLRADHYTPGQDPPARHCATQTDSRRCDWSPFRNVFQSIGLVKPDEIVAGQEPDRDWLTDPPKGYRMPTANTVATPDNSKKPPDPHDSKALLYQQPDQ
jgi:hypothetical protein